MLGQGWVVNLGYEVDHNAAPLIHDMAESAVPVDTKFDERHKATDSTRRQASQSSPRNKILPRCGLGFSSALGKNFIHKEFRNNDAVFTRHEGA